MEKKFSLGFVVALMLIASALTSFAMSLVVGEHVRTNNKTTRAVREYAALLEIIDEWYIGEYESDELNAAAMRAAVYELGDAWSSYMTPAEYAAFQDFTYNRYAGIGVKLVIDEQTGGMNVVYVYPNSAAEDEGVQPGDIIIAIDSTDILGKSIKDVRLLIERPLGDDVELLLLRSDGSKQIVTVVYGFVFISPVTFEMVDSNIGYIALTNFDNGAAGDFISACEELIKQGAQSFIFDVRDNGGGRVSEMVSILDYLLPEGEIFITVDKDGVEAITLSDPDCIDFPCVVLVDRHSYSAAEYFAATLGEYGVASIIGEQTSGKSRMQTTFTLPSGGALHISTNQYFTKNRVSLFDVGGLTPDYLITLSDEEANLFMADLLDRDADPHFQQALSLLQCQGDGS